MTNSQGYEYFIILLFLIDIAMTYVFMKRYRYHFPSDDRWYEQELNIIAKWCWRKFGLGRGSIISAVIIFPVIIGMVILSSENIAFLGFFFGVYYCVLVVHYHAHTSLTRLVRRKKEKMMEEELKKKMKKLKRKRKKEG